MRRLAATPATSRRPAGSSRLLVPGPKRLRLRRLALLVRAEPAVGWPWVALLQQSDRRLLDRLALRDDHHEVHHAIAPHMHDAGGERRRAGSREAGISGGGCKPDDAARGRLG